MTPSLYIGILSGTSMDGIDCALLDFPAGPFPRVLDYACCNMDPDLKQGLLALCTNHQYDLRQLGNADIEVALAFADAVKGLLARNQLGPAEIAAIGSHGQTIWHEPPRTATGHPFTLQIGDPNTLAERTGITVVADFRRRDMAAGGQGAPIVPALHRALFASTTVDRIILNLGGIANITFLPRNGGIPLGFDTGPANVLMDTWIGMHRNLDYDAEGSWAASGNTSPRLLAALLDEPYFRQPAPKSTGRELFNLDWLQRKLDETGLALAPADIQATLLELTATTISREILQLSPAGEIAVCGGGARNRQLMDALAAQLPSFTLLTTSELGLHADVVEAAAFAWLAKNTLEGIPVDLSPFTGARHAVIAGGIYPVGGGYAWKK